MQNYLHLSRIGKINDYRDNEIVAHLYVVQDIREVEHDGYCSDAGEDTGVWEYDKKTTYHLNEYAYKIMSEYSNRDGMINMETLNQLFPDRIPCGYCGYESDCINKSGQLVYMKNFYVQKSIKLCAYYMAEKDKFSQSPDTYWFRAETYIARRSLLKKALADKGLILRSDSKMCEKWMSQEIDHTLDEVVWRMVECQWCITYQNMFYKIREYKNRPENKDLTSEEVFSIVKKHILDAFPVPEILPWDYPGKSI